MIIKLLIFLAFNLQNNIKVTAQTATCQFGYEWFYAYIFSQWFPLYTCIMKVEQSSLSGRFKSITGVHDVGRIDRDVKQLIIGDENKFKIFSSLSCQKFSNLQAITTNNVKLQSLDKDALANCQQLDHLSLKGNEIPALPEELLKNNRKLLFVNFERCNLVQLPENLFLSQQKLLKLSLIENELSFLPANIFHPLVKLQTLDLDNNKLQFIDPRWFENLRNLQWLDFNGNKIIKIPSRAFANLSSLKSIYFNNNKIETLQNECFYGLENLQELGISSNELYDIPEKAFKPLKNLQKLELNGNKLFTIFSDSFGVHNQLSEIYLQENIMKSLDSKLLDVTALTDINMEKNNCSQSWLKKTNRDEIRKSLKTCFDLFISRDKLMPSCGRPIAGRGNIIFGQDVARGTFPWYAALTIPMKDKKMFFCGGNLISKRKIVTAAHCYQEKRTPYPYFTTSNLTILLGAYDLDLDKEETRVEYTAQSIHVNEIWDPNEQSYDGDIAVLVLSKDVEFTDYIQKICLCTPDLPVASSVDGFAAGYGASEDTSKLHENRMKMIYTPIHKNEECFFKNKELVSLSSKRTFCGGTGDGSGVCRGDTGGGVYVFDGYLFYLRGVVSTSLFGGPYNCDVDTFSIFTDVTKYIDWINNISEIESSDKIIQHY